MKRAATLVALLALVACNADPSKQPPRYRLEGSLTGVMELGYDAVRVLLAPDDLSVLFVRVRPLGGTSEDGGVVDPMNQGVSEDYPLRLGYRIPASLPDGGAVQLTNTRLDLAELDGNGAQRGTVSRNVQNDPRNTFPRLARGTLLLKGALEPDALLQGDFHVTFENGVEAASGRTAFSTSFTARVQP